MALKDIADELVAGCKEGRELANLDKIYHPDAVSVEAMDMGGGTTVTGVEAIKGKHAWWTDNHEFHGGEIEGPFVHGDDRFAVVFGMDVTTKATGERITGKEVAIYTVKDDRIVREEFYYAT